MTDPTRRISGGTWMRVLVAVLLFAVAAGGLTWLLVGSGFTIARKGVAGGGAAGAASTIAATAPVPPSTPGETPPAAAGPVPAPEVTLNLGADTSERIAVIRAIDKITLRVREFEVGMNQSVRFGAIDILVRTCEAKPPEEQPDSAVFLQIDETRPNQPKQRVFSGWMFAANPAVNALEHPIYDVWVAQCRMTFPDRGPDTVDVGAASAEEKRPASEPGDDAAPSSTPEPAPAAQPPAAEPEPTR